MLLHFNVSQYRMLQGQLRDVESDKKQIDFGNRADHLAALYEPWGEGAERPPKITSLEEKAIEKEK
jgi:hypothetical protein